MRAWQNARVNIARHAMMCDIYFPFSKSYNFIKGIMRIHSIFNSFTTEADII